jgi:hypothetical protein
LPAICGSSTAGQHVVLPKLLDRPGPMMRYLAPPQGGESETTRPTDGRGPNWGFHCYSVHERKSFVLSMSVKISCGVSTPRMA